MMKHTINIKRRLFSILRIFDSVRVVFNEQDSTEQVNHYYASGALMDMSTGSAEQPLKYNGKELLREWGMDVYDYGARWMLPVAGPMFMQPDPLCEKFYDTSPYSYCKGNFMNAIDPDGRDVYMLFYTSENKDGGDAMFRAAAETRKYDIEHSDYFDASRDVVVMSAVQDMAKIGKLVGNIVNTYSENFGKTVEFSLWSHASLDGPRGSVYTSSNRIDKTQMSMEGWSKIDFNWEKGATANFFGCRTGVVENGRPSFVTRLSARANFRNVKIHGQTSFAYPSIYANVRMNTNAIRSEQFSYPTYMVGAEKFDIIGGLFPTFNYINPMRTSINGKGTVVDYFQPGMRYK